MNKKRDNRAIVEIREEKSQLREFDKSAVANMHFQHAPNIPSPGQVAISMFETDFHEALPDLSSSKMFDFAAEGNHIVEQSESGGMHTDQTFHGSSLGPLPSASIGKMRFTGPTLSNAKDGKTAEKIDLDDVLKAIRKPGFFNGI